MKKYWINLYRTFIKKNLASAITQYYKGADVIAGVATAGIPHGALVAEELGLPFIYVRSKAKDHGKIEMLTDGEEERQFLHVKDCSNCLEILSKRVNLQQRKSQL